MRSEEPDVPLKVEDLNFSETIAKHTPKTSDVAYQTASIDIWDKKYRLKSKAGTALDKTIDDTLERVARA